MLFATETVEVIKYSTVTWYSHSQVHELLLTLALTAVAAAITAWWTRSTSKPKWKSLPKADAHNEVQVLSPTCSKISSSQDSDDWRSVTSNADTETTEADLSNHPDAEITDADPSSSPDGQEDDNDDSDGDSRVDVDSWGAVAGRFASALSLEYDDDDDDESLTDAAKSILMDQCRSPDGQQDDNDSSDGDSRVDVDSWGAVAGRFASALSLEDDDEDDWAAVAGRFASVLSLVDDNEDDESLSAVTDSILKRANNSSESDSQDP